MPRILLRIRPKELMEDLDLHAIGKRLERLSWGADLQDSRLSDAPYVVVIVDVPELDADHLGRLQSVLEDLPRMRVGLVRSLDEEIPLERADVGMLGEAAEFLARIEEE